MSANYTIDELDELQGMLDSEDSEVSEQARIEEEQSQAVVLDEMSQRFVDDLIKKIILFEEELIGYQLFPYQRAFAYRIIESLIINDGEELTGLFSRQSGKTETLADTVASCMILFPKLAPMFPDHLDKFKFGLWVGVFAPIEEQSETLHSRIVSRLTSDRAVEMMLDPEIDDQPIGGGKIIKLKKGGSFCRMQTANPRAKIESKSYHLILIDEAQGADEFTVRKSIQPMGAFYNATIVKIGTPDVKKGDFYRAIQNNKRRQIRGGRGIRQNHFEYDWRYCARYNPNYMRYVKKEMLRIGEDSDEFRLAYKLEWLLERGMFVTSNVMDNLGDKSMEVVQAWWQTPVVVGIDPARKSDSTVVTVVWVDWDRPDEFGYFEHRVLNWLEIHGDQWEEQYFQMVDFLSNYNVLGIAVDSQGIGDVVADRIARLIPRAEVYPMPSTRPEQSLRWKHLLELIQRNMIAWPAHAKTRRLKKWRRFYQQMVDLEKIYEGPHLLAAAPEEPEAHDDYPDSLALACAMTKNLVMPTVEVSNSPFYG